MVEDKFGYKSKTQYSIFTGDSVEESVEMFKTTDKKQALQEIVRRKGLKLHRVIHVQIQSVFVNDEIPKNGDAAFMGQTGRGTTPTQHRGRMSRNREEMEHELAAKQEHNF